MSYLFGEVAGTNPAFSKRSLVWAFSGNWGKSDRGSSRARKMIEARDKEITTQKKLNPSNNAL